MTKRKITGDELQRIQPPMSEAFEQKMLDTLQALPQMEEEPIMKKKVSMSVVLALVLILAMTAVALAVAYWRDTGEQIAVLEAENGYFDSWPTDRKIDLVRILSCAGVLPESTDVNALLTGALDAQMADTAASAIITSWANRPEDAVSLYAILETLNGPFAGWSVEDKAWYAEMLQENGMNTGEDIAYEIPTADAISQADAIRIGKQVLIAEYGITETYLDRFNADTSFITPTWEVPGINAGEQIWSIEFTLTEKENGADVFYVYMIEMKSDGTVLGFAKNNPHSVGEDFNQIMHEKGAFYQWSMEDQAAYSEVLPGMIAGAEARGDEVDNYMRALGALRFGFPGENDLSKEQAIEAAISYVKEHYGATDEGLKKMQPYVSFDITNPEEPLWRVKLMPWMIESYADYESMGYIVHIQSRTGEVTKSLNRPKDGISAKDLF